MGCAVGCAAVRLFFQAAPDFGPKLLYSLKCSLNLPSLAGSYTYDASHSHAVGSVSWQSGDAQSPSLITTRSSFTVDNRIDTIRNGTYMNVFAYSPSGGRFKVERYKDNARTSTKVHVGSSEFIYNGSGALVCKRTMVYAPTGICAVYQDSASVKAFHYIHTDYLGSWLKITDQNGNVENRYSYDAWGRLRNPNTWALLPVSTADALTNLSAMQPRFDRGYTGHEYMAGFGLINMNGRLYDPYLQRFLSPDVFIQDPTNTQSFNRFSYCLNNPLMYTDPSGWSTARVFNNTVDLLNYCWATVPYNYAGSFSFSNGTLNASDSWIYDGSGGANGTDGYSSNIGSGNGYSVSDGESTTNTTFNFTRFNWTVKHYGFWTAFKDAFFTNTTNYHPTGLLKNLDYGYNLVDDNGWNTINLGDNKPSIKYKENFSNSYDKYWGTDYEMIVRVYGKQYSDYNWVQTYTYNNKPGRDGKYGGFMYDLDPNNQWRKQGVADYQGDANMFFHDTPNAITFTAELTLVGKANNGWVTIQSLTWGFVYRNGIMTPSHLMILTNPSADHCSYLHNALKNHN